MEPIRKYLRFKSSLLPSGFPSILIISEIPIFVTIILVPAAIPSNEFAGIAFNAADNQETTRINFASATLPIALAGCDLATGKLEKAYRQWLKEIDAMRGTDQEFNRRLYHCFPKSYHWPLCTQFSQGASQGHEAFARALAISEMMPPSDSDRTRMFASAKNPREQGYAIFQFSGSSFWLWPFFVPNDPSYSIQGKPLKLGSNVKDACDFVSGSQDLQSRARKWVDWFEEHWSESLGRCPTGRRHRGTGWTVAEITLPGGRSLSAREPPTAQRTSPGSLTKRNLGTLGGKFTAVQISGLTAGRSGVAAGESAATPSRAEPPNCLAGVGATLPRGCGQITPAR